MNERMIKQFMEMVKIESESGNEANFMNWLKPEFEKLGANVIIDSYGNLIAKFAELGCFGKDCILFSCHGDTVQPGKGIEPVLKDGVIRSKGNTILGADDKAGIAELLEALRIAKVHPPVEVAISRHEEVGLLGVKELDFAQFKAKKGYLLDNDELETIIIGGPSYYAIDVNITGRGAHAGMEPEKGINAIQAAAFAIAKLRLGRLDEESTANVGVINGGIIRNGVPDSANFLAECRSLNHEKAEKICREMETIIRDEVTSNGAEVEILIDNKCKAVEINPDSEVVEISKKALNSVGINATTTFITGFTDASIYNNNGIEMAGVGIGAKLEHSTDEHIYISDMEKAKNMIVEIMRLSAE
ncbi:MAG: M20/M25/M40 family metallo-hydrolase [Calditrichaeota bacterium]|nr:MAG: M20/M25/M40 family metallo-hydrolase [Calditrichota bacterium]MBL1207749.1 M20/M25/M40 family metallo-hydrolase [Calditrichota bacterium]NOG47583.1 M20/M25/M40 family metallo-hydrolase [Calditrichota bacterium]